MKKVLSLVFVMILITASFTFAAPGGNGNGKALGLVNNPWTFLTFDEGTDLTVFIQDRAPSEFALGMFNNKSVLVHSIDEVNKTANAFYLTQGKKLTQLNASEIKVNLYIPEDWQYTNKRMAGFWGVTYDMNDEISSYPIVEFTSAENNPRFRVWPENNDLRNWIDIGLPENFMYNEWYTLTMKIVDNAVLITVGDLMYTVPVEGGEYQISYFGDIILQGHNTVEGVTYDIHWDNLAYKEK